jgi:hypothetical protein
VCPECELIAFSKAGIIKWPDELGLILVWDKYCFFSHFVEIGSGAQTVFCPLSCVGPLAGVKQSHSLPAVVRVEKAWSYMYTSPHVFVFFFFYWHYNPLWVLAFSVIFFHSALSSHCVLHRLSPIICKSSSVPAIHLFHGLPLVLVHAGFHCNIPACVHNVIFYILPDI